MVAGRPLSPASRLLRVVWQPLLTSIAHPPCSWLVSDCGLTDTPMVAGRPLSPASRLLRVVWQPLLTSIAHHPCSWLVSDCGLTDTPMVAGRPLSPASRLLRVVWQPLLTSIAHPPCRSWLASDCGLTDTPMVAGRPLSPASRLLQGWWLITRSTQYPDFAITPGYRWMCISDYPDPFALAKVAPSNERNRPLRAAAIRRMTTTKSPPCHFRKA